MPDSTRVAANREPTLGRSRSEMKHWLRGKIEQMFRRLPVSRLAYVQRDLLQARVDDLEALHSQAAVARASARG